MKTDLLTDLERRQQSLEDAGATVTMGPAGTGKTHTLAGEWKVSDLVVTPTNKAAQVLRSKNVVNPEAVGTIHRTLMNWVFVRPEDFYQDNLTKTLVEYAEKQFREVDFGSRETIKDRIYCAPELTRDIETGEEFWRIGVWKEISKIDGRILVDECSMIPATDVQTMLNLSRYAQLHFFGDPIACVTGIEIVVTHDITRKKLHRIAESANTLVRIDLSDVSPLIPDAHLDSMVTKRARILLHAFSPVYRQGHDYALRLTRFGSVAMRRSGS